MLKTEKMKYMKNRIRCSVTTLIVLVALCTMLVSCEYDTFVDAKYPDQKIYMPAARYNPYKIDAVPMAIGQVPTPGYTYRFVTDTVKREFRVLLGVYRSGINNEGSFDVNIGVRTDTINDMLTAKLLPTGTLPLTPDKYTIVDKVTVNNGEELAKFDLVVNLDTLRKNSPSKKYAIGVNVSSDQREVNKTYATTIILIDTKIMKPTASLTSVADGANPKLIKFTNTTVNGMRYKWSFGDGSTQETSNAVNEAVTHTYAAAGTYIVTLTAYGITDSADKSVATKTITVN